MPSERKIIEGKTHKPFKETVDISSGWDKQSYNDAFLQAVREFTFYRPDALYHGTVAYKVTELGDIVSKGSRISCAIEDKIHEGASPVDYAYTGGSEEADRQVVLVLDPGKFEHLEENEENTEYAYRLKPGASFNEAIIAIITIKG